MKYILANWKAYKNHGETQEWIKTFLDKIKNDPHLQEKFTNNQLKLIICPPHPFIPILKWAFAQSPEIAIGAQNISVFEEGKYTGETTAKNLVGQIEYTLIGHSERRIILKESEEEIAKKVELAKKYNIEPILCVRDEQDKIYESAGLILYEPVYAIGTGNNEEISKTLEMKKKLQLRDGVKFLYGGSVNEKNVSQYFSSNEIDGFIVGNGSLDPLEFYRIIKQTP